MRLTLAALSTAAALTLSACGGGGGDWDDPAYSSTEGVISALQEGGVDCDPEGAAPDAEGGGSVEAGWCFVDTGGEFYQVEIYESPEQQAEAREVAEEMPLDSVWGDGWSVTAAGDSVSGEEVVDAIGGELVEAASY